MKNLLILTFIFSSIFLASCGKQENIENTTTTNSGKNLQSEIKTENNTGTIQEEKIKKDYKIIDLTDKSKAEVKCDKGEDEVPCYIYLDFLNYGKYKVYDFTKYDGSGIDEPGFFDNGFGGKAYFNEKYNTIFVSFGVGRAGQIMITNTVKIELKSKQITKIDESYGSDFYFKDIDTIIPKYQSLNKYDKYTTELIEGAHIKIGGNNNDIKNNNNISGIDFIKNYYDLLGKGKIKEVYNITSWSNGNKDFDTFNSWYKNINKVDLIKIKDLGNNEYEIITDIFYDIENNNEEQMNAISFNQGGEFLSGIELYERYIVTKKIVEKDGIKKLESIKTINSYALPRIKVSKLDKNDTSISFLSYNTPNEHIYKKLPNGSHISFGDYIPHDTGYEIIIHGKKGDIDNYYKWGGIFPKTFLSLIGIKVDNDYYPGNNNETEKNKLIDLFKKAPTDMLEKTLFF